MKRPTLFWPILVGTYLLGSLAASHYALFGSWMQYGFGVPHYYNWDPDGYYLAAGIQFFDGPFAAWYGHPGLPLQFMIGVIAKVMYALSADSNGLAYPVFVAQNQYEIILTTKTAITVCYLASFYFLFKVARLLLEEWEARIAVLLFASSAIVLTYANKISPEPFLLLFVLVALYFSIQAVAQEQAKRAYTLICISGVSAALAMLTKLAITVLLPVYFLIWISIYPRISVRRKAGLAACFTASCLAAGLLFGWKMDWANFFSFWSAWSPIEFDSLSGKADGGPNPLKMAARVVSIMSDAVVSYLDVSSFFSLRSKQGQFNVTEFPLVAIGILGIFALLKRQSHKRWVAYSQILLMACLAPVVIWKGASHYRVVHLALLSIFAAYALGEVARRFHTEFGDARRNSTIAVCLLALSGPGVALALSIKTSDIQSYSKGWDSIYACLRDERHGHRVTLINSGDSRFVPGRLLAWYFDFLDRDKSYSRELAAYFSNRSEAAVLRTPTDSECIVDVDRLY